MSFAERCAIARATTHELIEVYCDPAVHKLPEPAKRELYRYADPANLAMSLGYACWDADNQDAPAIAERIEALLDQDDVIDHPEHYLIDRTRYEASSGSEAFWIEHDPYLEAWNLHLTRQARDDAYFHEQLCTIACTRTDGIGRAALDTLLSAEPAPRLRDTISAILQEPTQSLVVTPHLTPQDDMLLRMVYDVGDTQYRMNLNDHVREDHLLRVVKHDQGGQDSAQSIAFAEAWMDAPQRDRVIAAVLEKVDAGAFLQPHRAFRAYEDAAIDADALLCSAPAYALGMQEHAPRDFYALVVHCERPLPDDLLQQSLDHAQEVGIGEPAAWALAHGRAINVTDLHHLALHTPSTTSFDLFCRHPENFITALGEEPIAAWCAQDAQYSMMALSDERSVRGLASLLRVPAVSDATCITALTFLEQHPFCSDAEISDVLTPIRQREDGTDMIISYLSHHQGLDAAFSDRLLSTLLETDA